MGYIFYNKNNNINGLENFLKLSDSQGVIIGWLTTEETVTEEILTIFKQGRSNTGYLFLYIGNNVTTYGYIKGIYRLDWSKDTLTPIGESDNITWEQINDGIKIKGLSSAPPYCHHSALVLYTN